ncbi:chemotaxis protein CheB [Flavobacterium caseinilyticum]|uniref:protein-glutamate methylesterase n=1 Tax=Flavobacterium caseinilyticum TaxID=2541732 RepID=A0A4R5AVN4_9FLAO|nr:chemotaxis protein CheB [Flavobacterium caseinilyticum]TDD74662.1 chemotaxis protein CheB [Flavobacterium caseinilyticum]
MTSIKTKPRESKHQAVVIGASAGGLKAIVDVIAQLPSEFPLPILVVMHISEDASGNVLLNALTKNTVLNCAHAISGQTLKAGHVYLAPSGHHLLVGDDAKILITKGAHENRNRPAIDPLFRSAAVTFGNSLIAILLTGFLNDGTSGMDAVRKCGGICIVQDPADADYPQMPQNAINNVKIDYVLPLKEMGAQIEQLISKKISARKTIPKDVILEANIAKRVLSDLPAVNTLGEQVPFNCPGCGGVLWKIDKGVPPRYRCHTGHAYTAEALLAVQTEKIEETMWVALRMFEERKNLLLTLAETRRGTPEKIVRERAAQSQIHIDRIRQIIKANDKGTSEDSPA